MCKTLAKTLGIPISMSDCTTFTQAGYIGDDVEQCVSRLFSAAGHDIEATEHGIIVLDEIDKIASAKMSYGKDVGGEGVQQALLKIIEGTTVQVRAKPEKSAGKPSSSSGYPSSGPLDSPRSPLSGGSPGGGKDEVFNIRTDNILFICTGAFANLHKTILNRKSMGGIGFGASIRSSSSEASAEGVMLRGEEAARFKKDAPFFIPAEKPNPFGGVRQKQKEEKVNVLDHVQPADLQKYGMIPELIGRIPTVCAVSALDEEALVRVLTEPKNSLLSQEQHKFYLRNIELRFTSGALREIAKKASRMGTGARGLRHVVDQLLLQAKYETPGMISVPPRSHKLLTKYRINRQAHPDHARRCSPQTCTTVLPPRPVQCIPNSAHTRRGEMGRRASQQGRRVRWSCSYVRRVQEGRCSWFVA
jgi:ATP-dependent Clp protease ATP-binding subunit ClpX